MNIQWIWQQLEESLTIIPVLVKDVTPAEAVWRPEPESWSILEVMAHLYDEEREDFRARVDHVLHRPLETWPAIDPAGWVQSRHYQEWDLADTVGKWQNERQNSLAWLKSLKHPNWQAVYTTSFGPLTAGDLLASWVAHDILHIRQLVELRYGRLRHLTHPAQIGYAGDW
jgi:hypothetical protein